MTYVAEVTEYTTTNFQSSSGYNSGHQLQCNRLSTVHGSGYSSDSWAAPQNTVVQWIEVDFSEEKTIEAVELRPRAAFEHWMSSYKLAFSNDGIDYSFVKIANGEDRIFSGPSAMNDYVTSSFVPTQARFIRLYPLTYHSLIAVKWVVFGCNGGKYLYLSLNNRQ